MIQGKGEGQGTCMKTKELRMWKMFMIETPFKHHLQFMPQKVSASMKKKREMYSN